MPSRHVQIAFIKRLSEGISPKLILGYQVDARTSEKQMQ